MPLLTSPKTRNHFVGRHHQGLISTGPFSFLNPTVGYLPVHETKKRQAGDEERRPQPHKGRDIFHVWRSRDNRKGRHSLAVGPQSAADVSYRTPDATNTLAATWSGIEKMFVRYPVWDVSYDVAVVFTLGSIIWVINGFFLYLPLVAPSIGFTNESSWGGGLTALIGATVFEFGSVLLMLEAVNENRADCFGWALEEAFEDGMSNMHLAPAHHDCAHSHARRNSFLRGALEEKFLLTERFPNPAPSSGIHESSTGEDAGFWGDASLPESPQDKGQGGRRRKWEWCPSWHELRTHYLREIGFLACLFQMIGATIFWISGISGIPPLLEQLEESRAAVNVVFWLPQVIGGAGFITSSFLFMVEVQDQWWKPAPKLLGWHVGFWNLIGSIGFTLCGALGYGVHGRNGEAVGYASVLATFVGSWAFLIGSILQWYESLNKYPISIETVRTKNTSGNKDTPRYGNE